MAHIFIQMRLAILTMQVSDPTATTQLSSGLAQSSGDTASVTPWWETRLWRRNPGAEKTLPGYARKLVWKQQSYPVFIKCSLELSSETVSLLNSEQGTERSGFWMCQLLCCCPNKNDFTHFQLPTPLSTKGTLQMPGTEGLMEGKLKEQMWNNVQ